MRTLLLTASPGTAANTTTTTYSINVSAIEHGPLFLVYQTQEEGETLSIAGGEECFSADEKALIDEPGF